MKLLMLAAALAWASAGAVTYSESQRLTIWKAFDALYVRSEQAADSAHPEGCDASVEQMNRHAKLSAKLVDQGMAVLFKKYKLTKDQYLDISFEGDDKGWPHLPYTKPGC
ncbi:hypothetical protein [Deinococcus sp. UYEF24]